MSKISVGCVALYPSNELKPKLLCSAIIIALLQGCSVIVEQPIVRPVFADLPAFDINALAADVKSEISEQQLEQVYEQLLRLAPTPEVRQTVLYRLSQLRTHQLERQELPHDQERAALQRLITDYQILLASYPDNPNNELIHYQLARSFDLLGQSEASQQQLLSLLAIYPSSEFAAESWFRVADRYYAVGNYEAALQAFEQVITQGEGPLKLHAYYMAGWSQFQLGLYAQADQLFLQALDQHFYISTTMDNAASSDTLKQELFRILSVSLSMQRQSESLSLLLTETDYLGQQASERPRKQQADLYEALANFLFERQLPQAALQSYAGFISRHPDTLLAAELQLKIIQYYLSVGNAEAALQAQQQYVFLFGPETKFWANASLTEQLQVAPNLRQYLDYLVRQQYQQVSAGVANHADYQQLRYSLQSLMLVQEVSAQLPLADQYLSRDDLGFLLAETEQQLGLTLAAYNRYQQLGYPDTPLNAGLFDSSQAAYRALLLAEQLKQTSLLSDELLWQEQQRFIDLHSQHPAAVQVALQQLQQRYNEQDYRQTLQLVEVLERWPEPAAVESLLPEARFIRSQAQLALSDYSAAEQSLRQLLAQPQQPERQRLIQQQLASSIYQQAQLAADTAQQLSELERLLQLPQTTLNVAIDPTLAEAARYQQIQLLLQMEQWASATPLLQDFIASYPVSAERDQLDAVLLQLFLQQKRWPEAAKWLVTSVEGQPRSDVQRDAWWQAISLWQQAGDIEQERLLLRQYVDRYPTPHLAAQQSRWRLAEIYQSQQDSTRRLYWLQQLATMAQPQLNSEPQSQLLAASALLQLGLHEARLFQAVALRLPLANSLQRKKQHMTKAIQHFEQSMAFNQAELYSQASFEMAQLYQQMATALLQSDRPRGLSAMALEQYDMLLEEQAYPFEELAIAFYQRTAALSAQSVYDQWVQLSLSRLAQLYPARFSKQERILEWADVSD